MRDDLPTDLHDEDAEELVGVVGQFRLDDARAELTREVFAHFGRAFYMANCLERGIAATLLHVEWRANLKPPLTRAQYEADYDAFEASCARLPMGALVRRLLAQPNLSASTRQLLAEALEARNRLAHHYFWERAGEFTIVPEGQLRMISECDEATALFELTDNAVEAYLEPFLKIHGVTDEVVSQGWAHVIDDARQRLKGTADV